MPKINHINDIDINLQNLLDEYKCIEMLMEDVINHGNKVLVQKKFHIVRNRRAHESLKELKYTTFIIKKIKGFFNFTDVTYRIVMPNTAYNWHFDMGKICYHIPLITNNGCFFIYDTEFYKLNVGKLYKVENDTYHTFVNSGASVRLHLTFENL